MTAVHATPTPIPTPRTRWLRTLLALGATGAALNAGVMFGFSTMVVPGLDRAAATDPSAAVRAMQGINAAAVEPPFMIVFLGTAVVAVALGATGLRRWRTREGRLALAGAGVFLLGVTVLTVVHHVPLNDALAAVTPGDDQVRAWAGFTAGWTVANHVRAAAALVAAVLFGAARHASGRLRSPDAAAGGGRAASPWRP